MTDTQRNTATPIPLDQRTINRLSRLHAPQPPPLRRRTSQHASPGDTPSHSAAVASQAAPSGLERIAYSVDEAAAATGLSRTTINTLIREGKLPKRKIGTRTVIPASALRQLVGEE